MTCPNYVRIVLASSLLASATLAVAQTGGIAGRWACVANGKDVDIRMADDQATIAVRGDNTRVLKRVETRTGALYSDGVIGMRYPGSDRSPTSSTQWIEDGQWSQLTNCMPVTG